MRKKAIRWINFKRLQELEAIKHLLLPWAAQSARLLEIGGGNGFLAQQLTEMGFEVISIDPAPRQPSHFPVREGNAANLEFGEDSFDVIFSSNVLEHIVELPGALEEMKRVLKPNGIMVHTMPTPFNTVLTMLSQPVGYLFGVGFVINQAGRKIIMPFKRISTRKTTRTSLSNISSTPKPLNKQNLATAVRMLNPLRLLISPAHGASLSCFRELHDWKPQVWREKFARQGLEVTEIIDLPLTYSRHHVFPYRFIKLRRRLAEAGKTSCRAYLVRHRNCGDEPGEIPSV